MQWRKLDRWEVSDSGSLYTVWWKDKAEPENFQGEPTLTTWPTQST